MSSFVFPSDKCNISAETGLRVGPSGIATFVIGVCAFLFLGRSIVNITQAQKEQKGLAFALGCITIECVFFGLYVNYYNRCRVWSGWALYVFASVLVIQLFSLVVPPPVNTADESHWFSSTGISFEPVKPIAPLPA